VKKLHPVSLLLLIFSLAGLAWLPIVKPASSRTLSASVAEKPVPETKNNAAVFKALYDSLDLDDKGLSEEAFRYAVRGYEHMLEDHRIEKPGYLTICDFSRSSNSKRLFLIDMSEGKLVKYTYVAHGRNSGAEFASNFSNRPESLQSSLGFYITGETYIGQHGLSLRVNGIEEGINDNAYQRAIVVHGANYIGEKWGGSYMGRSFGCPAVPAAESAQLINTIKNGSVLFIYHPTASYLKGSKILNG